MKDRSTHWWNRPEEHHIVDFGLDEMEHDIAEDIRVQADRRAERQTSTLHTIDPRFTSEPVRDPALARVDSLAGDPTAILEETAREAEAEERAARAQRLKESVEKLAKLSRYLALEELGLDQDCVVLDADMETISGDQAKIRVVYYEPVYERYVPGVDISPVAPMPKQRTKYYYVGRDEWFRARHDYLRLDPGVELTVEQRMLVLAVVLRRRRG